MIRSRLMMLSNPLPNRVQIAPDNNRVDQLVTPAILEIALVEAEPQKIIGIVRQRQIEAQERPRDAPRFSTFVSSTTACSGHRYASGPKIVRACAVCSGLTL